MAMSRAHSCIKSVAPFFNSVARKIGSVFGSSSTRWICSQSKDFTEELSKGKRFGAVWGNGDFGRLGLGKLESQWRPKPISPVAFDDQSLKEIACGGAHTLFLTENGDVYATGLNDFGQLGISNSPNYTTEPLRVSSIPQRIAKISAGYHHSAAITVDGELYIWGKNANGQLGLGKKAERIIPLPCKVQNLDGVVINMISLGFEHSIAVTDKGEALSWGGGDSGRLGHGHESSIFGFQKSSSEYTPRLIRGLEGVKVKSVSAGMLHSACISENGSVYFFGERELGKWGFGKVKCTTTPSVISALPLSEEVSCGAYHTCVIANGGDLYTWGSNENGCLGTGCTDFAYSPERVEGPFLRQPVSKVSCGWKHTSAISGGPTPKFVQVNFGSGLDSLTLNSSPKKIFFPMGNTKPFYPIYQKFLFVTKEREKKKKKSNYDKRKPMFKKIRVLSDDRIVLLQKSWGEDVLKKETRFTLGAGVVQTEHLQKMGIHQAGSWGKATTLTTLNRCCSTSTRGSNHYKYLADLIIQLEYSNISDSN